MRAPQLQHEKDVTVTLPLAVSFAKALGADYFGVLPRSQRGSAGDSAAAAAAGLVGVAVVPPDQQALFLKLFRAYFKAAGARLLDDHKVDSGPAVVVAG